jgi:hypothetical protein
MILENLIKMLNIYSIEIDKEDQERLVLCKVNNSINMIDKMMSSNLINLILDYYMNKRKRE